MLRECISACWFRPDDDRASHARGTESRRGISARSTRPAELMHIRHVPRAALRTTTTASRHAAEISRLIDDATSSDRSGGVLETTRMPRSGRHAPVDGHAVAEQAGVGVTSNFEALQKGQAPVPGADKAGHTGSLDPARDRNAAALLWRSHESLSPIPAGRRQDLSRDGQAGRRRPTPAMPKGRWSSR